MSKITRVVSDEDKLNRVLHINYKSEIESYVFTRYELKVDFLRTLMTMLNDRKNPFHHSYTVIQTSSKSYDMMG